MAVVRVLFGMVWPHIFRMFDHTKPNYLLAFRNYKPSIKYMFGDLYPNIQDMSGNNISNMSLTFIYIFPNDYEKFTFFFLIVDIHRRKPGSVKLFNRLYKCVYH